METKIITTTEELNKSIQLTNGKRKTRIVGDAEIARMETEIARADSNSNITNIRVYSYSGFVPNSYRGRADISYIVAERKNDGWIIAANTTDAHRSYGNGSLVTINGRAA